jgi:hypothetical protein
MFLSAPGTWLFDVDSRTGARDDDGDVRSRHPAATSILVGVAIVFACGEIAHILVLGPLVADMAPAHLLGRYLSLSLSLYT